MDANGLNTSSFGIGIYQPISGVTTTVGSGFTPVTGAPIAPVQPYSGVYGGTYGFVLYTRIRQPKVHVYTPAPAIGLDNLGVPVVRGFPSMTWSYSVLKPDSWYYLRNLYQLAGLNPPGYQYLVLVQYLDESAPTSNPPIQQLASWDPPTHAYRDVGAFYGVTLTFRYLGKAQMTPGTSIVSATS